MIQTQLATTTISTALREARNAQNAMRAAAEGGKTETEWVSMEAKKSLEKAVRQLENAHMALA